MTQMHDHGDIWIGNLPLNYTDEDGCRWIVQEVDGWWGLPPAVIPEDERPYNEDGNYWTSGRYGPRTIQITGVVVPPRATEAEMKSIISRARDRLAAEINLVRQKGRLTFHEVGASKSIDVQLLGLPLVNTSGQSNVLHFDLQFVAQDPRKYSTEPQVATASLMNTFVGGREYPKTYNIRYGDETGTNEAHVVNIGDTVSHSSFRITGPVIEPQILHEESGAYIKVNLTLGADDYLDIDLLRKTVILNGTESRLASLDFDSTWFVLTPGDNTLRFNGTQVSPPQEGWAAATNRVTNPSAERAGSAQTIHQNLLADPSITTLDVMPTTTRTNMAVNPTFEPTFTEEVENLIQNPRGRRTNGTVTIRENLAHIADSTGGSGAMVTLQPDGSLLSEGLSEGSNYVRIRSWESAEIPLVEGEEYTASIYARADDDLVSDADMFIQWYGPDGYLSPSPRGERVPVTRDGWSRVISHGTVPEGATHYNLWVERKDARPGDRWMVRDVMFERGSEALPYFDGDTSPDPDFTPEWTGTPGESVSVLTAPALADWAVNGFAYYSASRDAIAVRATEDQTQPYIHQTPATTATHTSLLWVETSDGEPVTVSIYRTLDPVVQMGAPSGSTVRQEGTGQNALVARARTDLGDRTAYFRIGHVPGSYSGPYFDGHTTSEDPVEYAWSGEEDASTSTRKVRELLGATAGPGAAVYSSKEWASSGEYSLKILPTTESADTYADITPPNIFILRGRQITVSGSVHVAELGYEDTEDVPPQAALVLRYTNEEETVSVRSSSYAEGRAALSARIPETATDIRILAYNGQGIPPENHTLPEDLSVYWDDILISAGGVSPEFFDLNSEAPGTTYSYANGSVHENKIVTTAWTNSTDSAMYSGPEYDEGLNLEFYGSATVSTALPAELDPSVETLTIGATIKTGSDPVLVTPILVSTDPTVLDLPAGEEIEILPNQERYISAVLPKPEEPFRVGLKFSQQKSEADPQIFSRVQIVNALISDGAYSGEYFDGDTPIPDLEVAWSGGKSIATALAVPGYAASDNAYVYQSSMWASSGAKSLAVVRKDTDTSEDPTYAVVTAPSWASLPAGIYTLIATVSAEDGEYLSTTDSRTLEVVDSASGFVFRSEQAPVGVPTRLSVVFEKTGPTGEIRLVSNALGPVVVRWDGIMIVAGEYTDRYFDGTLTGASWSGTAHNSTSTQTARQKIPAATLSAEYRHSWLR